jgi:hypothetical protein
MLLGVLCGSSRSLRSLVAGAVLLSTSFALSMAQTATPDSPQTTPAATAQKPMTKEQAKQLFRSVDEILGFVSSDTKLPIEHTVKRKLISRDQVNHYLREKFDEDEGTKRMERSEIVLKKFGLLDPVSAVAADRAGCRFL